VQVNNPQPPAFASGLPAGAFATTHWSVVVRAGDSESPEASSAMERLCRTYWYPLYVFGRRKGKNHEDACDSTQAFFALFLEKGYLRSASADLGKFRTFLLTAFTRFLSNEWDRAQTPRRGGGCTIFSLDDSWTYNVKESPSKSRNSPFDGRTFKGAPVATIVAGRVIYKR